MEKSSKIAFRVGDMVSVPCIVKTAFTDSRNVDRLELTPCGEVHGTFYTTTDGVELTGPKHQVGDWVSKNYASYPVAGQIKAIVGDDAWVSYPDGEEIEQLISLDRAAPMPPVSEKALATLEERELSHKTIQGEVLNG